MAEGGNQSQTSLIDILNAEKADLLKMADKLDIKISESMKRSEMQQALIEASNSTIPNANLIDNSVPKLSTAMNRFSQINCLIQGFSEQKIELFFTQFERIMEGFQVPSHEWSLFLQGKLFGRALDALLSVPHDRTEDYNYV